jgi:hypothetical protein
MKLIAAIFFSMFSLFSLQDLNDDIAAALKQGNSAGVVKHFAEKVSIKVLNQEDLLSKAQAQAVIEEFFSKRKVKSYSTSHTSIINGNQQFLTGSLETSDGKYRISILIRGNVISQFRIEHDND